MSSTSDSVCRFPRAMTPARHCRATSSSCVINRGVLFAGSKPFYLAFSAIIAPVVRSKHERGLTVTRSKFLMVEGPLQNQDGVVHVNALRLTPLLVMAQNLVRMIFTRIIVPSRSYLLAPRVFFTSSRSFFRHYALVFYSLSGKLYSSL